MQIKAIGRQIVRWLFFVCQLSLGGFFRVKGNGTKDYFLTLKPQTQNPVPMKRFLFSLALMALLPAMAFAEHVEPTRAQKAAKTFLSNNDVRSAQLTDVAQAAGFTNLYIFNAHPGFVVMAADDCAKPILGYSFTDSFSDVDMPDNMRWWLQQYDDEIQQAIDGKAVATPEITQ